MDKIGLIEFKKEIKEVESFKSFEIQSNQEYYIGIPYLIDNENQIDQSPLIKNDLLLNVIKLFFSNTYNNYFPFP